MEKITIKLNAEDYARQVISSMRFLGKKAYGFTTKQVKKLGLQQMRELSHFIYDIEDMLIKLERSRKVVEKNSERKGKR